MKRVLYYLLTVLVGVVVFSACSNPISPSPANHLVISPATRDITINRAACFTADYGGSGIYTWELNVSTSFFNATDNMLCFVPAVLGPYRLTVTVRSGNRTTSASALGTVIRP